MKPGGPDSSGYLWEDGPWPLDQIPEPTQAAWKPGDTGRCMHCRQPVVKAHGLWWHARLRWHQDNPQKTWWSVMGHRSDTEYNCPGAYKK